MEVQLKVDGKGKLEAFIRTLGPGMRAKLHTVGANSLHELVRRHLRAIAPSRHSWADRLGGKRTMHIENAIGSVAPYADAAHGEVVIPITGIGRAFHDVEIEPVRANRLTVPINAISYGKTVRQLKSRGWKFFQGKKGHESEDILFGYKGKGRNRIVKPLFVLKTYIHQKQDPSLLPTQAEASSIVVKSIATECKRIIRNAH